MKFVQDNLMCKLLAVKFIRLQQAESHRKNGRELSDQTQIYRGDGRKETKEMMGIQG